MTILCVVLLSSKIAFSHPVQMVSSLSGRFQDRRSYANTQVQVTFEPGTDLVKPSMEAI